MTPDAVLAHPELRRMIDFSQPVGVLMTAVMHFIEDSDDPWGMVDQYMSAMPPGSYLALSHATYDKLPPRAVQTIDDIYKNATSRIWRGPGRTSSAFSAAWKWSPRTPEPVPDSRSSAPGAPRTPSRPIATGRACCAAPWPAVPEGAAGDPDTRPELPAGGLDALEAE